MTGPCIIRNRYTIQQHEPLGAVALRREENADFLRGQMEQRGGEIFARRIEEG
jgi:hypothetical protein